MFIKFKKVIIHNFLSIGDAEIDLDNNNVVLVEGHNTNPNDSAISNGSGKSSIFNAICWALTGETIQGVSSNIVNIYGSDGCYVKLFVSFGGDEFEITRLKDYHKDGNDLKIIKNGIDISGKGIRESTRVLENNMGELNSELVGSIIILGQGLPHKFSNNTPSGRKELLEKLSKSDFMIEDIKVRLNSRRDTLNAQVKSKQDAIIEERAKLGIYDGYIIDSQSKLRDLEEMDFSNIDNLKDLLENDIVSQTELENKIDDLDAAISSLTTDIVNLSSLKDSELQQITGKYNDKLSPIIDEQYRITKGLEDVEFKLEHADDDICPTCGQKIPNKAHIDKQPLLDRQVELNDAWKDWEDKKIIIDGEFQKEKLGLSEKYDITELNSKITNLNVDKINLNNELKALMSTISTLTNQIAVLESERESYQRTVTQLKQTITLNVDRKEQVSQNIVYYTEEESELSQHLDVINQMLVIVKRDFRGYLLTNVIDFIGHKANEYSNIIFGNALIGFKLDGNNINISYGNKMYENLSGGEKQKVDLIIQFALKDMLSNYLNIYCNILVLDEIFDNLDSLGCQKVLELISTLQDVDSVYIISHHADELQIAYDTKMIIEKDNSGISKIVR